MPPCQCDICVQRRTVNPDPPDLGGQFDAIFEASRRRPIFDTSNRSTFSFREPPPPEPVPAEYDDDCESCKLLRKGGSSLTRKVLNGYSSRPDTGWRKKRVTREVTNIFLGVELETDRVERRGVEVAEVAYAVDMARPATHWHAKSDGSVTGPEFASHPATLRWWTKNRDELAEMFRMLIHGGYRSHNGGAAGMHVNIGREAFTSGLHMYKVLHLLHEHPEWSIMMAQRTTDQARRWARVGSHFTLEDAESFLRESCDWSEKYSAMHSVYGQGRIEFRLPRGTLRVDRFFKNLEWPVAMIEYAAGMAFTSFPSATKFMEWVADERADRYPNLLSFINEKSSALSAVAATR